MNLFRESQGPDSRKTRTKPLRYPEEFSEFAQWRNNALGLDSHQFGLTVCDIDQVFFHDDWCRKEAYILLLELKSHGKTDMEMHEKNIYNLFDSVFQLAQNQIVSVELWGRVTQRKIRYMGWHLLVLDNTRPDNSAWMLWDKHDIPEGELVKILGFELDPYTWLSKQQETQPERKFVEMPREDTCPICGSSDWWYRPASELGGPGERLCGRCHPNPNKERQ